MGKFKEVGAYSYNPKWENLIKRIEDMYERKGDTRTEFYRDFNRILHSNAYRRLKNKTQVFFATRNDHICTRIEHVNHVASVSYTISKNLGLNTELTNAIAIGHDLGHAPFGHQGEYVLFKISKNHLDERFWHEKNSLFFIDNLETLRNPVNKRKNLNLTYAVRDGIIMHCGEVDENQISPREEFISLDKVEKASQYSPYTWEGCVVKISDKISYLGRDIEDAITEKILSKSEMRVLKQILKDTINLDVNIRGINNTVLIHNFIKNLCEESTPDRGLCFSSNYLKLIENIKAFNYKHIYEHKRLGYFKKYVELIIESIFDTLLGFYDGKDTNITLNKYKNIYPFLTSSFKDWLIKYTSIDLDERKKQSYENRIVYNIEDKRDYIRLIIHYISGMTDNFAIKSFQELTSF